MAGKWTGGIVESMGGEGPPTVEEWTEVAVPGRPSPFAGESGPVAYRTRFSDPRSDSRERTILELEGLRWKSRIWLNGALLGDHDTPFVPARFEFDPEPENELLVVCAAPGVLPGDGNENGTAGGADGSDARFPSGVEPELAAPGIYRDVSVGRRPRTFLRGLEVSPRVDDDGAEIDVAVEVDAADGFDGAVTLSLRPEGFRGGGAMERVSVDVDPGERVTATRTLSVRDPSLWWPRDLGPQHRYAITAKVDGHSVQRTVGLRRVDRDDEGFLVNGSRVRARGFGRLPGDGEHEDVERADAERADVERALEANATIVRPRGHVPSHAFYEACDEAGLLVWQDLPTPQPPETGRATATAEALAAEYGHHPSVAAVSVADVPQDADPFASPLGSGRLDGLRFRWRTWRGDYDRSTADAVANALSLDVPTIPVTGPPGTGADATTLYPGWRYLEADAVDRILDRYPQFGRAVGGFGAGSMADGDGDPGSIPGLDPAVVERLDNGDGTWGENGQSPEAYQATTVRTVAEALRRRECGLLVVDAIRDAAPGGGMGVVDAGGDPKAAYEAIGRTFEPVQAVLDDPAATAGAGSVGLTLCNDSPERVEPVVRWRAGEESGEGSVAADPFATAAAGTATIPADADELAIEVELPDRTVHNRYHF